MLSRSSSDARTRLRRSKSASTVHRYQPSGHQPLDPRIAQQHAVTAATTAFTRAHGLKAVERPDQRSSELSRAKSTSSRKSLTSEGSHFPHRESSVRSVNRPKSSQAPSTKQLSRASTANTEKFPSFYPTPRDERPLSTQASVTFNDNFRLVSQPRSHRPSAASSITSQQIRKARSMYYASSVQTGSPIARPPGKYLTSPPPMSITPTSDLISLTMSARNKAPSPLALPQIPVQVESGETIDKARDKYLQNFQQQPRQVKHRPSLFLAPFKKRQDRARSEGRPTAPSVLSVASSKPVEPPSEPFDDFGMPKEKKEKRSLSDSLKDKIKKVFRRTSNNPPTKLVQHIEASRDYFNSETSAAVSSNTTYRIPSPDGEALLRIRSRDSSLERMPTPLARPESRGSTRSKGSNKSLHSETNAMSSRVTSWNDSSTGNTLTQRDIKRLTVIHESKDSISSEAGRSISSTSLRRKAVPLPTFTAFKDPMPMESLMEETFTPLDPKRVFSALMKEMDATNVQKAHSGPSDVSPGAESDVFESSTTKELHAMASREHHSSSSRECRTSTSSEQRPTSRRRPDTAQSKASSIRSLGRAPKSTIRTATPIEHGPLPIPTETNTEATRKYAISTSSSSTESRPVCALTPTVQEDPKTSPTEELQQQKIATPTAGQLEQRMIRANERWKMPLDEHQHHGPLHHRSHARTISASEVADAAVHTPNTVVGIPGLLQMEGDPPKETTPATARATPVSLMSRSPRLHAVFSPLSPSIYSRNTDGISILPNDSVMSFESTNDDKADDDSGSAVIITTRAVKSYVIGTPSPQHKTESTGSSKDWRAWLSHEISELDSPLEGDLTIYDGYSPTLRSVSPTARHHRELTQIEDDRTTIGGRASIETQVPSPVARSTSQSGSDVTQVNSQLPSILQQPVQLRSEVTRDDPVSAPNMHTEKREISPLARTSAIRKNRHSSAHSYRSAPTRSANTTPQTSTMNERFPFIDTGRRASMNSARLSRSSRSATDSGSSTKSKGTPVGNVYSDLTPPITVNRAPHSTPSIHPRESKEAEYNKANNKENVIPSYDENKSIQSSSALLSTLASKYNRPKSTVTVSSTVSSVQIKEKTQPLTEGITTSRNTASANSTTARLSRPITLSSSPQRQRARVAMLPIPPNKLTTRPKSAFELRGKGILPLTPCALNTHDGTSPYPRKKMDEKLARTPDPHMSLSGRSGGMDQTTLRMLVESPWAGAELENPPQPVIEHFDRSRMRPRLHAKHDSSTLALHREPSPGLEEQTIDALIDERPLSRRSNFSSVCGEERGSVTGRITPGQRMAERYLRERSAPRESGAGTPCSEHEQRYVRTGATGQILEREDTPAFL